MEKPHCPFSWARLGQRPVSRGRADGPHCPAPPQGPRRPSTSAKGPAQQLGRLHHPGCVQSRPQPPEALHDVTRADRRKEQAPRSCRMQGRFLARQPAKRRCAPHPRLERWIPGPCSRSPVIWRKPEARSRPMRAWTLSGGAGVAWGGEGRGATWHPESARPTAQMEASR